MKNWQTQSLMQYPAAAYSGRWITLCASD